MTPRIFLPALVDEEGRLTNHDVAEQSYSHWHQSIEHAQGNKCCVFYSTNCVIFEGGPQKQVEVDDVDRDNDVDGTVADDKFGDI